MERKLTSQLVRWKHSPNRKPLILEGARQVGKTYLLRAFGETEYTTTVYVNFDNLDPDVREVFAGAINPSRIIDFLAIKYSTAITPSDTLIIFDEIQQLPRALSSLKYFAEDAPEYHVVAAGSLLGVTLHPGTAFPVGKVDFLRLEPLSFEEFCWANGQKQMLDYVDNNFESNPNGFKSELSDSLREYIVVGGMPQAVATWRTSKDIAAVDTVLSAINNAYRNDFSKHTNLAQAEKMNVIWQSIPSQFAKANHKFMYGVVRPGARAREYELSIAWLVDAGLIRRVYNVSSGAALPLSTYQDLHAFKLYALDIGLLRMLAGLSSGDIIGSQDIFGQFGGIFAEQFVLQQLAAYTPYYWTAGSRSEVDFVIQTHGHIVPIEVKSGENVKAKSLRVYRGKYNPRLSVRFSLKDATVHDGLANIPLYYIFLFPKLVAQLLSREPMA